MLEKVVGVVSYVDGGVGFQHLDEPLQLVQLVLDLVKDIKLFERFIVFSLTFALFCLL